jgi:hypothetical protein
MILHNPNVACDHCESQLKRNIRDFDSCIGGSEQHCWQQCIDCRAAPKAFGVALQRFVRQFVP